MDRLIYPRNRNWIAPLERMLNDSRKSRHCRRRPSGSDGSVLDLLAQAGYEIERIQ
ncbi:MAG: TraB/GumN family protein [Candidatus Devosia euplotis]|nr:TraB/GumN family protein [Candidatus Devosia euplotis]